MKSPTSLTAKSTTTLTTLPSVFNAMPHIIYKTMSVSPDLSLPLQTCLIVRPNKPMLICVKSVCPL